MQFNLESIRSTFFQEWLDKELFDNCQEHDDSAIQSIHLHLGLFCCESSLARLPFGLSRFRRQMEYRFAASLFLILSGFLSRFSLGCYPSYSLLSLFSPHQHHSCRSEEKTGKPSCDKRKPSVLPRTREICPTR